jgi:MFS family permease
MELEDLKNRRRIIQAPPESAGERMGTSQMSIDHLIEMLKTEDAKQLKALKHARPLWWIGAVLFVFSFVVILLSNLESTQQLSPGLPLKGLLALVFSGLAAAVFLQIRKSSAIDYTEPTSLFLQKTAKRYQFMSTPALAFSILIASVLAAAASLYIVDVFERYFGIHDATVGIAATFGFVALVFLFGFYVTKKDWKQTRGRLLDDIKKLQDDLQGDTE